MTKQQCMLRCQKWARRTKWRRKVCLPETAAKSRLCVSLGFVAKTLRAFVDIAAHRSDRAQRCEWLSRRSCADATPPQSLRCAYLVKSRERPSTVSRAGNRQIQAAIVIEVTCGNEDLRKRRLISPCVTFSGALLRECEFRQLCQLLLSCPVVKEQSRASPRRTHGRTARGEMYPGRTCDRDRRKSVS